MTHSPDIAAVAPMLELTIRFTSEAPSLRCTGTLDARTRDHVLDAVDELLRASPSLIVIDVTDLQLSDFEAADALAEVQFRARQSGASLQWQGLDCTG